jgi:hypothetical protein
MQPLSTMRVSPEKDAETPCQGQTEVCEQEPIPALAACAPESWATDAGAVANRQMKTRSVVMAVTTSSNQYFFISVSF